VRLVRADLAVRAVDQLVDLLLEHAAHRRPLALSDQCAHRRQLALANPVSDRLVITTRQLRRSSQRPRQVIGLQDFHHFLSFLQQPSSHAQMNTALVDS
jgi:hypothetical protein